MQKAGFEKNRIVAEIQAKAEQERANEDVTIRKLQMQASLDTDRMVSGIRTVAQHLSNLVLSVLSQPKQLAMFTGIIIMMLVVYYLMRELITMLRQFIQSRLGRPSLVRETSYEQYYYVASLLGLFVRQTGESLEEGVRYIETFFTDVILSTDDIDRVVRLALTTRNTKKSKAPYRHVLLYGPPGTGKTLIARKLAACSGMDYAIMSGGDVGPLGNDAVSQLHSLFRWAASSKRGLLLFIDEAEAFLSSRSSEEGASSGTNVSGVHLRHALNALLFQTGVPSSAFMLVLATNRPEDLDSAVLDRIDVTLHIGLPALPQRINLVNLYFQMHILKDAGVVLGQDGAVASTDAKVMFTVSDKVYAGDMLTSVARRLEGFSGREISKLFIAVRYATILAENNLSEKEFEDVLQLKIHDHMQKKVFSMP